MYLNELESGIRVIPDCKPYPYPQSFAFFKMLTPLLKMTDGKKELAEGLNLNLSQMDEALSTGRGYYELMADVGNEKIVLRFNINAFRNNYFISDLVKMNLEYHAIEVGTVDITSLTMESEFGKKKEKDISGFDLVEEDKQTDSSQIKVYDVILAGVSR